MAPSASLQSRIQAFENLQSDPAHTAMLKGGMRPVASRLVSPPPKPIVNDQDLLDSEPTSPSSDPLNSIQPLQPVQIDSRASSPAALGRKSSLIHFSELASPQYKSISPIPTDGTGSTNSSSSDSFRRPQLPPRPSPQTPALPPRKPSVSSLKTVSSSTPPPPLPKRQAISERSTPLPQKSNSLLSPDSHTYPPSSSNDGATSSVSRHVPSSSTSSFHSVSLSSDGGDTHEDSLDGSYEAVSSTVATSPVSSLNSWEHDGTLTSNQWLWKKQAQITPPVIISPAPINISQSLVSRRPAPPPPQPRSQNIDPPLLASPPTLTLRPVPIPESSKRRYDDLFDRNIQIHTSRKHPSSGSGGWRGLSLDLPSNTYKSTSMNGPSDDRLDGAVVKRIWKCSKLRKERLREIW